MSDRVVRMVRIRTTHDDGDRACGVAMGVGATPGLALAGLEREARELAQREAQPARPARVRNQEAREALRTGDAHRRAQNTRNVGRAAFPGVR